MELLNYQTPNEHCIVILSLIVLPPDQCAGMQYTKLPAMSSYQMCAGVESLPNMSGTKLGVLL